MKHLRIILSGLLLLAAGTVWADVLWEPRRTAADVVIGDKPGVCDCERTPTMTRTPTVLATPVPPTPTITPTPVYFSCIPIEEIGAECVWEDPYTLLITLNDDVVYFDTSKDTLKPLGYDRLKRLSEVLRGYPENNLYISGHTDIRGTYEMNTGLSERRAYRVRNTMVGFGLPYTAIRIVEGHAFDKPVATNKSVEGRARNRRTEVRLAFTTWRWNAEKERLEAQPADSEPHPLPDVFDTNTIDDGEVDPTTHGLPETE